MLDSLERRWTKMDQPLFLLAYVLHPGKKLQHLNHTLEPFAWTVNILCLASEAYVRFFGEQPDASAQDSPLAALAKQLTDYLNGKGFFGTSLPHLTQEKGDPTPYWELLQQVRQAA